MKCQKCAKPATFHITDISRRASIASIHFCDEHARQHLAPPEESLETPPISELAKKLIVSAPGSLREPSAGRQAGLPGLPDHVPGVPQLGPAGLSVRLRGLPRRADAAAGEHPRRDPALRQGAQAGAAEQQQQTTLIQLRNELKRAVAAEDYETAARLRDKIKVDRAGTGAMTAVPRRPRTARRHRSRGCPS